VENVDRESFPKAPNLTCAPGSNHDQRKTLTFKRQPLRNPGQSLDEQIHDLISDYALGPLMLAFFLVFVAAIEWLKYYRSLAPAPFLFSSVALAVVAYPVFRFFRVRQECKSLQLGRDGEKAVGQYLDSFRERGYKVFHDIIGDGFNIDHVLIGPAEFSPFRLGLSTHEN
jgi:hypothetical protein